MAPENPWFLITQNEILEIQKRLRHLETELPESSRSTSGKSIQFSYDVRDRLP